MKRLLTMLALLAGSTAGAHFQIVDQLPTSQSYLEVACEYVGGECPAAPVVIFTPTKVGTWGFHYRGTSTVFVTDRCLHSSLTDIDWCNAIIVHEVVHYVVGEQGRFVDSCANERMAWAVTNAFLIRIGRFDLVDFEWIDNYPKCQPTS